MSTGEKIKLLVLLHCSWRIHYSKYFCKYIFTNKNMLAEEDEVYFKGWVISSEVKSFYKVKILAKKAKLIFKKIRKEGGKQFSHATFLD